MDIDTLLRDFANKRWDSRPFERLVELATSSSGDAARFAEAALSTAPQNDVPVDLALSFVSEDAFRHLVEVAIHAMASAPRNDAAEAVIAHGSLQFPELLHPHLSEIFSLRPNEGTYYENWPWRGCGAIACDDLLRIIDSQAPDEERLKAWLCLLEIRSGDALRDAVSLASKVPLAHPVGVYSREVGYDSPTLPLYQPNPWHLFFDPGFFATPRPAWIDRSFHPTWQLLGDRLNCRFGGYAPNQCGLCGGRLHHLIALPGIVAHSDSAITLATCLSCLGWERSFLAYRHDDTGLPRPVDSGQVSPQFPATALKETFVRLAVTPPRWRWQDWALSNSRENLCRVGGHPSWIQSAEYPDCPSCGRPMHFLMQLDSDLPTDDGKEFMWGSGGICYAFWCAPCRMSGFLWQCT